MNTAKAFSRRRKLSAIIWVTLALCAGLTALQMFFGFSLALAALALLLGALAWSERRAHGMFAANDPRGGWVGFWNQLALGVLGSGYLFWSAATLPDLQVELTAQGVPQETAEMITPLVHEALLISAGAILLSQIVIAFYDLRVAKFPRNGE